MSSPSTPQDIPISKLNPKHLLIGILVFLCLSALTLLLAQKALEILDSKVPIDYKTCVIFLSFLGEVGDFLIAGILYLIIASRERAFSLASKITEKLRESERKYRSIFDSFQDIFLETDKGEIITSITPSATKILGFPETNFLGKNLGSLFLEGESLARFREKLHAMGSVEGFEFKAIGAYGQKLTFSADCHEVTQDGIFQGLSCIIYDITLQTKKREDMNSRSKELEDINRILLERELKMSELKEENRRLKEQIHAA